MPRRASEQTKERKLLKQLVARRLKMAREVLSFGQAEFARRAGLAANTYNMIEMGVRLPSIEHALALVREHKLTLDYIFQGLTDDLPHNLGKAIEALDAARQEQNGDPPLQ